MKHTFLKHALWAALFAAGAAMAQDAAISGADFTHGKADAQLAAIGGKAAAAGQTVVVTAPTYWQGKVAAKIRAGAHGKPVAIRFSTGFYENVLVRTEASAPVETKPEARAAAKPQEKPQGKPEPKVATRNESEARPAANAGAEIAKAEPKPEITAAPAQARPAPIVAAAPAPKPAAEPPHVAAPVVMQAPVQQAPANAASQPAPQMASNIASIPQVSHQPAVVPIPTAAINAGGMATPSTHAGDGAAVRQHMLASLNDGRPAMGSLVESQLRQGDQVYADGDTLAVVRLEGLHRDLYWLQGPVDLQRVQFMPQGEGHYEVTGTIDPKAPAAHRASADAHRVVSSNVPAAGSPARARLEQQYNNGQPITSDLTVARLQPEDRLLVDGGCIIVARREGNSMARYWLDGSIDLGQSGLQKVDGNVYRVIGNSLH
ncbi:MAG TPA: hypothetical protein VFH71_11275 [Rhodanobacteraceae bacterium]|nr:hypothetical protein [Rhodanobacteraceae bacterium]